MSSFGMETLGFELFYCPFFEWLYLNEEWISYFFLAFVVVVVVVTELFIVCSSYLIKFLEYLGGYNSPFVFSADDSLTSAVAFVVE